MIRTLIWRTWARLQHLHHRPHWSYICALTVSEAVWPHSTGNLKTLILEVSTGSVPTVYVFTLTGKNEGEGLGGMEVDECVPAPGSVMRRCWHTQADGPVELMRTSRPTNRRGYGSTKGFWKMGAVKWKTAEKRTVWVKSPKVSSFEHTSRRKVLEEGVCIIVLLLSVSESVRGVSDPRASVVRSGFNSVLRKPPLGSRGEQTDRAAAGCYRRLSDGGGGYFMDGYHWCAQRWLAELWMTSKRGGVATGAISDVTRTHRNTWDSWTERNGFAINCPKKLQFACRALPRTGCKKSELRKCPCGVNRPPPPHVRTSRAMTAVFSAVLVRLLVFYNKPLNQQTTDNKVTL